MAWQRLPDYQPLVRAIPLSWIRSFGFIYFTLSAFFWKSVELPVILAIMAVMWHHFMYELSMYLPHATKQTQAKQTKLTLKTKHKFDNIWFCFKQHFDTRYLAFCNLPSPRMFLSLGLLSEYRIQQGAIGTLYVTSSYSTWIFCREFSGFATDCPCGVWCRGTTCLLHVGPSFGSRLLNNSWAVGLT